MTKVLIDYSVLQNEKIKRKIYASLSEILKNNEIIISTSTEEEKNKAIAFFKKFKINGINKECIYNNNGDLVGLIRELRIDCAILSENKMIHNQQESDAIEQYAKSNMAYKQLYEKKENVKEERLTEFFVPPYTSIIYYSTQQKEKQSDNVKYTEDFFAFAKIIENLKQYQFELKNKFEKSYDFIPKTGIISIDQNWKKYWISSKYEGEIIDDEIFNLTPYQFIKRRNRFNLDKPFIKYLPLNKELTYEEVFDYIERVKSGLLRIGVKKGDVIALSTPNVVEDYILSNALGDIGAIIFPLHPLATEEKMMRFFEITKPNRFIGLDMDDNEKINLPKVISKFNMEKPIIIKQTDIANPLIKGISKIIEKKDRTSKRYILPNDYITWSDLTDPLAKNINTTESHNRNDTAKYYTTGGTTSDMPKIVEIPYSMQNVVYYNTYGIDVKKGSSVIVNYPRYIAFSDANCTHLPASYGGLRLVFTPFEYPKDFAKIMEKEKISIMQVAPQFYQMMLDDEKLFENIDLSSVKYIVGGGDKWEKSMKQKVISFFERHNNTQVQALVGYGCTELDGSAMVQLFETNNYDQQNSIGIPLPNFKIRLVDEDGKIVTSSEQKGRLQIGGDNTLMKGYLGDEKASDEVLIKDEKGNRFYDTADIVEFESDQNRENYNQCIGQFITREKRFIMITRGSISGKVIPQDIEHLICDKFKEIKECCVVGINENNDTMLKMVVTLNNENQENVDELIENIKETAAKKDVLNQISQVDVIETMPITQRGKINYREVENHFSANKNHVKSLKKGE